MESKPPYLNTLSLSPYGKAIPYVGNGVQREDGHANHGFRNLKVKPELIDAIPELVSDSTLRALLKSLNARDTSFFSVGCFSGSMQAEQGHRYRGYVEFSWNCKRCVQDAINYFSLFFHFEQFLRAQGFGRPVKLNWVVEEAKFLDVNIDGFCCAIFINTPYFSTVDQAYETWQASLQMIESFLCAIPKLSNTAIYHPLAEQLNSLAK